MTGLELFKELNAHGVSLTLEGERLKLRASAPLPAHLLEAAKAHKAELIALLSVPRLPWQLERLVSAAASDLLPAGGAIWLRHGIVMDINRYVLGWAAAYLVSNQGESLERLWEVYHAWEKTN